jgi:hypothetical protein
MEQQQLEALSSATLANAQDIEELQQRSTAIESELTHLRDCVRTAFAQAGIQFEKSGSFVSSRVPTLERTTVEPTTATSINAHLKSSRSGTIGIPPSSSGGDGGSMLIKEID